MKKKSMIGLTVTLAFLVIGLTWTSVLAEKDPAKPAPETTASAEDEEEGEKEEKESDDSAKKIDDWVLKLPQGGRFGSGGGTRPGSTAFPTPPPIPRSGIPRTTPPGIPSPPSVPRPTASPIPRPPAATPAAASASLGFAVGGAKDINNFRRNIEEGYLPLPSDLTVEGLYYDYFFDTGTPAEPCRKLFCPVYSLAISPDPLSGKEEYYMSVGLTSDMKAEDFERKKLNLVVVLDISGSMGSPFNRYHYDGKKRTERKGVDDDTRTKMQIANEAVQELTRHLREDDHFGMVIFDNDAYLAKPMNPVGKTDMDKIRGHIGELKQRGGTNFEAGYKKGSELFENLKRDDPDEYENRIIFLTDAMPNRGQTDDAGLFGLTERNARKGVHTTFVGVGIDFNSELIEAITKVRGANYHSVHSAKEFKKLLTDDFEYMVTPMVFDLSLQLVAKGVGIEKVYGSPEADQATGELMRVNTLFPSRTEEGEVKGGLVLLKLDADPRGKELVLRASYERRDGSRESDAQDVRWPKRAAEGEAAVFGNTGIRKGVLLARYANLLVNWMREERSREEDAKTTATEGGRSTAIYCSLEQMPQIGICLPPDIKPELGRWERTSMPLKVRRESRKTFEAFLKHFDAETKTIGDADLKQESKALERLIRAAGTEKKKKKGAGKEKMKEKPAAEPKKKDDWKLPKAAPPKKA